MPLWRSKVTNGNGGIAHPGGALFCPPPLFGRAGVKLKDKIEWKCTIPSFTVCTLVYTTCGSTHEKPFALKSSNQKHTHLPELFLPELHRFHELDCGLQSVKTVLRLFSVVFIF